MARLGNMTVTVVHRLKWAGVLLTGALLVGAVGYPWFQMGYDKAHMTAAYAVADAATKKNRVLIGRYGECVEHLKRVYDRE